MKRGALGFGILEAIAGAAIAGIAMYGLGAITKMISTESDRARKHPTMLAIESNLGLAMEKESNFTPVEQALRDNTDPTGIDITLADASGTIYGNTLVNYYFTARGDPCGTNQNSGCVIKSHVILNPKDVNGYWYISYELVDTSTSGSQLVPTLGDITRPSWIIPPGFYLEGKVPNCTATSLLLRGFDPHSGVPTCWAPPLQCKDGQIAKEIVFDDATATSTLTCVDTNAIQCLNPNASGVNGYVVESVTPSSLDPTPIGGGPPTTPKGTCVYYSKPTVSLSSKGTCPGGYIVSGGVCILDPATHGPETFL